VIEDNAVKKMTDAVLKRRKYLYFTDISIGVGIPITPEEIVTKLGKIVLSTPEPG